MLSHVELQALVGNFLALRANPLVSRFLAAGFDLIIDVGIAQLGSRRQRVA